MTGLEGLPPDYRAALLDACAAALDAGIFHQGPFGDFVVARLEGADPARDSFLGVHDAPEDFAERSALLEGLRRQVGAARRGTWALVRQWSTPDRPCTYVPVMSDGSGGASFGGGLDSYAEPPDYATVFRRMAGYEAYLGRDQVEAGRSRARNLALIEERGFAVGVAFHKLRIGCAEYSTLTITALHPAPDPRTKVVGADDRGSGWLSLALVERGSRKRYRADLPASQLARAIDEARQSAAPIPAPLLEC